MADWTQQTQQITQSWIDAQKTVWDNWLGFSKQFDTTQTTDVWSKSISLWEEAVQKTLEAQVDWTRVWADRVKGVTGVSTEMTDLLRQYQELTTRWCEAQQQVWESWFSLLRSMKPGQTGGDLFKEGQKVLTTWQETTQKLIDAQGEWAKRWGPARSEQPVGVEV